MNTPNSSYVPAPLSSPWTWLVPALCLLASIVIVAFDVNQSLFLQLNHWSRSELGALFWANVTILGDTLVAFSLLGLFARKRPDIVWALLLAALFATAWVHILKPLIDNPRPLAVLGTNLVSVVGVELRNNSFPSGHTATAFTLAGVICLRGVPVTLAVAVLLLAILAGISRTVVGAHWPLDVFAGAFGGWIAAIIGVALSQRWVMPTARATHIVIGLILLACGLALLFWHDLQYPAEVLQVGIGLVSVMGVGWYLLAVWRQTRFTSG